MSTNTQDADRDALLQKMWRLPVRDQLLLLAYCTAMVDQRKGTMSEDDAKIFQELRDQGPLDSDAIDQWLIDHGYFQE